QRLEPGRRIRGLPVSGPCRVLRDRRVHPRPDLQRPCPDDGLRTVPAAAPGLHQGGRGQGSRGRRTHHRREGAGVLSQRGYHRHGWRSLGLLPKLHLPSVRGRPAGHHHHRADDLPGGAGDAMGSGPGCRHPGVGPAAPHLPARRAPAVSDRLCAAVPGDHPAPAARDPADRRGPPAAAPSPSPGGRCSRPARGPNTLEQARRRIHAGGRYVMTDLLSVHDVTKIFGGVHAVDGASLRVQEGTITALIGPNGSGKTTLFNIITGYLKADAGRVEFDGRHVTGSHPGRLYRQGLSRTFQQARIFPQLTVQENLVVAGGYEWRQLFTSRVGGKDRERPASLLEEFRLTDISELLASELSYGQRKLLEFAAVLMSSPRLVLLDEPTAGVNPVLIETMERHIRERNAAGITFLIVEHDMTFVMRLCDPVIVLDAGKPIFAGEPSVVQNNPLVLDAYLGS